ncbi:MAG: hypothetical protein AAFX65_10615 [Cyanobacteria bacterium J06638_7]
MTLLIVVDSFKRSTGPSPEALAWIAAVEAADGQALEPAVAAAMAAFFDWRVPYGGACCLLKGARTLAGALTPLIGPAPTAVDVSGGDYTRYNLELGPDTIASRIETGFNTSNLGLTDHHVVVRIAVALPFQPNAIALFEAERTAGSIYTYSRGSDNAMYWASFSSQKFTSVQGGWTDYPVGLYGVNRNSSTEFDALMAGVVTTEGRAVGTRVDAELWIGDRKNLQNHVEDTHIDLYSAGAYIDSAEFASQVEAHMAAIEAALP